jgi:hypothetical protein
MGDITIKHKAKRRLTNITFEHLGAHVALVSVAQGGPANGVTTLITKAAPLDRRAYLQAYGYPEDLVAVYVDKLSGQSDYFFTSIVDSVNAQMKDVTIQSLINKACQDDGEKAYDLTMQMLQARHKK